MDDWYNPKTEGCYMWYIIAATLYKGGTRWRSWLTHSAINRKVAVSIRGGVRPHYGPGFESGSNRIFVFFNQQSGYKYSV